MCCESELLKCAFVSSLLCTIVHTSRRKPEQNIVFRRFPGCGTIGATYWKFGFTLRTFSARSSIETLKMTVYVTGLVFRF